MPTLIKSYQQAKEYLGDKTNRPYAHNTRIKWDSILQDDIIMVTYHDNPIVHFHPEVISLFSCGWMTPTTKERLNWFIPQPWNIYQRSSVWYARNYQTQKEYVFADGITFSYDGLQVWNMGDDNKQAESRAQIRRIKKYVDGYITELLAGNIDKPSEGDCWFCLMHDTNGKAWGEGSQDHILSHMEESYYVPSLLVNAIAYHPVCMLTQDGISRIWNTNEVLDGWQRDIVTRDIKSSLTKYIKKQLDIAG